MTKPGPKPKPRNEVRTVQVNVRLTEDEAAAIRAVSKGEGLSTWVRRVVVAAARRARGRP